MASRSEDRAVPRVPRPASDDRGAMHALVDGMAKSFGDGLASQAKESLEPAIRDVVGKVTTALDGAVAVLQDRFTIAGGDIEGVFRRAAQEFQMSLSRDSVQLTNDLRSSIFSVKSELETLSRSIRVDEEERARRLSDVSLYESRAIILGRELDELQRIHRDVVIALDLSKQASERVRERRLALNNSSPTRLMKVPGFGWLADWIGRINELLSDSEEDGRRTTQDLQVLGDDLGAAVSRIQLKISEVSKK